MVAQGVMCDLFLMPSIVNSAKKYGCSKTIAGVFLALGITIPELIVTMISFHRHGARMTEFGLAVVFGGACFAFSAVPAVGYFINFGVRNKR